MVESRGAALGKLKALYIDCGDVDQFNLVYGARRLVRSLKRQQITHRYEEFPDDHSNVDYRMDLSLAVPGRRPVKLSPARDRINRGMEKAIMDRRLFVRLSAALAATAVLQRSAVADAEPGSQDERLHALLDTFLDEMLQEQPESATQWGLDSEARAVLRSRLDDYSSQAPTRWLASCKSRLERLGRIDRARLSVNARVDRDMVNWWLDKVVALTHRFPFGEVTVNTCSPYVFSQLSGPYQSVPDFLDSQHPVRMVDDAEAYLARLALFPAALDATTEALRADAARGILAPDFTLDTGIGEVAQLRAGPAANHGLVTSLSRRAAQAGLAGDWAARASAIVADKVYPALDRQHIAATEARRRATHDAGVWKLPDGEAYYAAALAFQTTVERTPKDVHRLGLDQVSEISARIDTLLREQGYTAGSVAARVDALSRRPDQFFPNDDTDGRRCSAHCAPRWKRCERGCRRLFVPCRRPRSRSCACRRRFRMAHHWGMRSLHRWTARARVATTSTSGTRQTGQSCHLPTLSHHEALPGHLWQAAVTLEGKKPRCCGAR